MLVVGILFLSGVFNKAGGAWSALDLTNVVGQFGRLGSVDVAAGAGESVVKFAPNFRGIGGTGARDAWLYALWLVPTVMVALGVVKICEYYDGLRAAQKLLTPLLRPFLGISGVAALALTASLTSADAGAGMTRTLVNENYLTEKERLIFVSFQFPCPATVSNYFSIGAAMIPFITVVPVVLPLAVILVMKIFGANMCRLYVNYFVKEGDF